MSSFFCRRCLANSLRLFCSIWICVFYLSISYLRSLTSPSCAALSDSIRARSVSMSPWSYLLISASSSRRVCAFFSSRFAASLCDLKRRCSSRRPVRSAPVAYLSTKSWSFARVEEPLSYKSFCKARTLSAFFCFSSRSCSRNFSIWRSFVYICCFLCSSISLRVRIVSCAASRISSFSDCDT